MSPEIVNALVTLVTALIGAVVGYLAKRQNAPVVPAVPVPAVPVVPAPLPADHPLLQLLLSLIAAGGKIAPLIPLIATDATTAKSPLSIDTGTHLVSFAANGVSAVAK